MIEALVNGEGIDVLERTLQFAGRRHALIAHNVANLSTPRFQPADVDPASFRSALGEAIEKRRETHPGRRGELPVENTKQVRFGRDSVSLRPRAAGHNVLFHDRNDRDLERTMQALAENTLVYRQAAELIRSRFNLLTMAIRERP